MFCSLTLVVDLETALLAQELLTILAIFDGRLALTLLANNTNFTNRVQAFSFRLADICLLLLAIFLLSNSFFFKFILQSADMHLATAEAVCVIATGALEVDGVQCLFLIF